MIRLIEAETPVFAAFCAQDALGARILAALRSYTGLCGSDAAQCWAQSCAVAGESLAAAIALADGFATLYAEESADWDELAAFLRMQPWRRLQCGAETAAHLPFAEAWRSRVLRFRSPGREPLEGVEIIRAEDLRTVYDLLEHSFASVKNRDLWMADMALRWRRGTARSWLLLRKGEALATASAIALTETFAYIGAVATLPEARGQGLAGELLARVAEQTQAAGREVVLSCLPELAGFYRGVGFGEAGEWVMVNCECYPIQGK